MSLYLEHFNLQELPFRITPAVEFFYRGGVRGETLDALKYAIDNGEGIISVVGEVGTGKSMLCRMLMTELVGTLELVYVANPSFSDLEIIYHIAEELGIDISVDRHQVTRNLQNHLLGLHQNGRRVLVCIDEAQAMPDNSLEQIRLLSNLETGTDKIVQIVMFGQPELSSKLNQQHMRQLRERITSSFYLRELNLEEVSDYIRHRLATAGVPETKEIFQPRAIKHIARISQGISRRINILCDKSMLAAFADNSNEVTQAHAQQAGRDARYRRMEGDAQDGFPSAPNHKGKTIFAGLAVFATIAAVAFQVADNEQAPASTSASTNPQAQQQLAAPKQAQQQAAPQRPQPAPQPQIAKEEAAPDAQPPAQSPEPQSATPNPQKIALVDNTRWHSYPPSSYIRQRLNATETQFRINSNPEHYTARILTVPLERAVAIERYLRDLARFFDVRNVMIYPARAEGADVFVITYGLYPSEFQAELFIHELPSFFRSNKPFTQALAVSQLEAASNW